MEQTRNKKIVSGVCEMEWLERIFLAIVGMAGGVSIAGGVFTTLIAVGLIPRFAGKTHTAKHIFLYEEMVVCGTVLGAVLSVFFPFVRLYDWFQYVFVYPYIGAAFLGIYGIFAGIFVGCLALAIAEILDSIPIFARRMKFRKGVGIAILCMAVGKTLGSLIYFWNQFFE